MIDDGWRDSVLNMARERLTAVGTKYMRGWIGSRVSCSPVPNMHCCDALLDAPFDAPFDALL